MPIPELPNEALIEAYNAGFREGAWGRPRECPYLLYTGPGKLFAELRSMWEFGHDDATAKFRNYREAKEALNADPS